MTNKKNKKQKKGIRFTLKHIGELDEEHHVKELFVGHHTIFTVGAFVAGGV